MSGGINMNDISTRTTFQQFLLMRCEEITLEDEKHIELNKTLLKLDNSLKKTITPEAYKIFLKYEAASIQQEYNLLNKIILKLSK